LVFAAFCQWKNGGVDLILGTAQLTRPYGVIETSAFASDPPHAVLQAAKASGYAGLDTAPIYGDAEKAIGESNLGLPVHTKIDPTMDGLTSIQQSRIRLAVERLDVVYQHAAFDGSASQVEKLEIIREESRGMVGSLGVSVYTRREFDMAVGADVVSAIQVPLNVANHEVTGGDIREAQSLGKRVYARSIFLQGVLAAPPERLPDAVSELREFVREFHVLAARWGISPVQAAIAFVKSHEGLSGMVIGANTVANVKEIADAFNKDLETKFAAECRKLPRPDFSATDPRTWS
jgi:aryl-alcohol dehydrogenase-like predicted oxidoreductase